MGLTPRRGAMTASQRAEVIAERASDREASRLLAQWTLNDSRQDDEPEHVCGPWPYLFDGECAGCQWREDRA